MTGQKQSAKNLSGLGLSVLLHLGILLVLAFIYLPQPFLELTQQLIAQPGLDDSLAELDRLDDPGDSVQIQPESAESLESAPTVENDDFLTDSQEQPEQSDSAESLSAESVVELPVERDIEKDIEKKTGKNLEYGSAARRRDAARVESFLSPSQTQNHPFAGRGDDLKRVLIAQGGGCEGSEQAVALGLYWLAQHQNSDGSWSYNFADTPQCRKKCSQVGLNPSLNSSTAFGLLPFLGAGITPKQGKKEYRNVVEKGLKFLVKNGRQTPQGISYMDVGDLGRYGGMYHQGITALVLCEAAAMTNDSSVKKAAQGAIDFISWAQTFDGGWRYIPQDPGGGDTSVLGWQILALQSAKVGNLRLSDDVLQRTRNFLDRSVALDGGSQYSYMSPLSPHSPMTTDHRATTAIGLLTQMYMGWTAENPALVRGIAFLSEKGPDQGNLYYNYYATQVMHHYGGMDWYKWNRALRDSLIERQVLRGHERGSWYFEGQWNAAGGRLYTTSLVLLILEVYYRHLPLYQTIQEEVDFPLD
ncbi:MAG: prenyltransferase/squalene oxidase repeat-containing protein [Thermoguttaceae bacterium]